MVNQEVAELGVSDLSIATSFEEYIAPWTVLIHWRDGSSESWGTGTIIASSDGGALVVTARHVVLGHSGETVKWSITRGLAGGLVPRTVEFVSDSNLQSPNAMFLIHNEDVYDVAQILVPAACTEEGQQFTDDGESVPSLIEPAFTLKPGAAVAWAGFPVMAYQCMRRHTMCVYSGIVAASSLDPPVYLIDGNVAPGVSGGPVWDATQPEPTILGVVSSYWFEEEKKTPGLSHFVPLNEMGQFIKEQSGR